MYVLCLEQKGNRVYEAKTQQSAWKLGLWTIALSVNTPWLLMLILKYKDIKEQ